MCFTPSVITNRMKFGIFLYFVIYIWKQYDNNNGNYNDIADNNNNNNNNNNNDNNNNNELQDN